MLVYGQIMRENDREERTFLKMVELCIWQFFFNQSKPLRNVYVCSEQTDHHNYFKPLAGNYFPADLGVQLKVH